MTLIILDRDGVINQDSDDYIKSAQEWQPIPGSIDAIARLCRAGYRVAVATNQSGLGRGLFDLDDLEAIHDKMRELVESAGGHIAGIYYCPHLPAAGCNCRKPAPGLLDAIAEDFSTPLTNVVFIGDSLKDLQAGVARRCRPILLRTGKGAAYEKQLADETNVLIRSAQVYDDLSSAVDSLLEERN
ncbi:MAG: D-glycero-beta-D-manno-heptose 1,7-bisphosphate 7-phosphatase [Gammaproteobacteria bacterium]|nr:D-glycero-beta-D-manno-heptose 1,7-bisphosphate 7-phosphatase [Gammaproteobacteria bacterium]MBQ0839278.1 D-glycero-beta-D-manno-heptose 1,7-bisphosphate 7-phosphatase [Gammaproteobacteria bacterium]